MQTHAAVVCRAFERPQSTHFAKTVATQQTTERFISGVQLYMAV